MSQQHSVETEARPIREIAREWEGQVVDGEFQLRQYLGGSDHSAVFLTAYDDQGQQQAAIKLIPADSEGAELQLSRWEMAASLSHPNLLGIYEMGRCQVGGVSLIYVVTEYAEENLSQILPQRALTPDETRGMIETALEVLAYIHGEGFVHGRISPSNIMASDDQLKLSIDCLCPAGEPPTKLTRHALPEPATALFPANDVWALGMLLVEVLTQRAPAGDSLGLTEPAVPETLPAPFFDIARNCLRKDPCRRWTVSDITLGMRALPPQQEQKSEQITEQKTPEQEPLEQITPVPRATSAKRRNMMSTLAIALLLVAAVTVPKLFKREAKSEPVVPALTESTNPPETQIREQVPNPFLPPAQAHAANNGKVGLPATTLSSTTAKSSALVDPAVHDAPQAGVIRQVLPDVPERARNTIRGTVRVIVRVSVDSLGNVKEAALDAHGPSAYFANLAVRAAQQWKFSAPNLDGRDSPDEWLLRFEFSAIDTKAVAVRSSSSPRPRGNQ